MDFIGGDNWENTEYGLLYKKEGIKFVQISNRKSFNDVLKTILAINDDKVGVISDDINEHDLSLLRKFRISYIIKDKEFKVFKSANNRTLSARNLLRNKVAPTLIASPTGLEIIDTILWSRAAELDDTLSGFSHRYNLSRPKLTHLMKAFEVDSLVLLKEELLLKDINWWLDIFDNPITKRKMTPSRTKESKSYSMKVDMTLEEFESKFYELRNKKLELEFGGISFLKLIKNIRTNDYDLLVNRGDIFDVVRHFKARPTKKGDSSMKLVITPLISSLGSERFESHFAGSEGLFFNHFNYNLLRILWGINYPESRIQEQRRYLLEGYLAKARSEHTGYMD